MELDLREFTVEIRQNVRQHNGPPGGAGSNGQFAPAEVPDVLEGFFGLLFLVQQDAAVMVQALSGLGEGDRLGPVRDCWEINSRLAALVKLNSSAAVQKY